MSLDATKPTDQALISELPRYIREIAEAVNAIVITPGPAGASSFTITTIDLPTGTYTLTTGTDLTDIAVEIIYVSAANPCTLETITGGTEGQIKIFMMQTDGISFKDGVKTAGKFYLDQLPALSTLATQQDDILALINVDGDGVSNNGYWKELYRDLSVK